MEGCHAEIDWGMDLINRRLPQLVQRQETLVMGTEIRMSDPREIYPAVELPLWAEFLVEQKQPAGVAQTQSLYGVSLYGVYSDCAGDQLGEYSLVLATEVDSIDNPPEQMVGIAIPAGCYLVFKAAGASPTVALQLWQQIWQYFRANPPYQRAFTIDFELYEPQQTSIYIAVKQNSDASESQHC